MIAQKRDANERGIIDALEAIGCSVDALPGGNGRPDLLIGAYGLNLLFEVKVPGKRKLNTLQKQHHAGWKGTIHLVESISEAVAIVKFHRSKR